MQIPVLDKFQVASEGLKDGPGQHTQLLKAAELSDSDSGLLGATLPSVSCLQAGQGWSPGSSLGPIASQASN